MAILKEVTAIIGKYTDKNGQEKNQYLTIGKVLETKNGSHMIKIDTVPVGWDGWAYLNEPRAREERQESNNGNSNNSNNQDMSDENIPF